MIAMCVCVCERDLDLFVDSCFVAIVTEGLLADLFIFSDRGVDM